MASTSVRNRIIVIDGRKTSVTLEDAFWDELKNIAGRQDLTIAKVVGDIDTCRHSNLSSAIRLFVLNSIRTQIS